MAQFATMRIAEARTEVAPDGSDVRILLGLRGGAMSVFELPPGQTSIAVSHTTVEEIWLFLAGHGEMWRRQEGHEETMPVEAGVCITIPLGTHFQVRALGDAVLTAVAVTMPPWPGEAEAAGVEGRWPSTSPPGSRTDKPVVN